MPLGDSDLLNDQEHTNTWVGGCTTLDILTAHADGIPARIALDPSLPETLPVLFVVTSGRPAESSKGSGA